MGEWIGYAGDILDDFAMNDLYDDVSWDVIGHLMM